MGFFKVICYAIVSTYMMFLVLNHLPNLLEFEPQHYVPKLLKFEGTLAINKELDKAQVILEDQVSGPESLALRNGEVYVSLSNGKIVKILDDKKTITIADTSGWPLGLRFFKDDLYVADIEKGILKVNIETGKVTVLVDPMDTIGGKQFNYPNDLDIQDGVIYFSVSTTRWGPNTVFYGLLEHENSGRVCKHDIATGKTEVLVDQLYYPNGIQMTKDKSSLLIAELVNNRILRHHFSGPKKGKTEIFADLPGEPDNIRPSSTGGYWVTVLTSRNESSPELMDRLAAYPNIRKALARMSHLLGSGLSWVNQYLASDLLGSISEQVKSGLHFLYLLKSFHHSIVVEVDGTGSIARSFHSTNPKFAFLSQGSELDGYLYLGSFCNPYIVKLKLQN